MKLNLDTQLRAAAPAQLPSVNLVAAVQARLSLMRRWRRARWSLAAAAGAAAVITAAWWSQRHLGELMLYPWTHTLHDHWATYWLAVGASAPKAGLMITLILVAAGLICRRLETFYQQVRTISVSKERTMITLPHWSRLTVAAGALTAVAAGAVGLSYAQGDLTQQLTILHQATDSHGHKTVTTSLGFNDCNAQKLPNLTDKYQVKDALNLSATDLVQVIEASCNVETAQAFVQQTYKVTGQEARDGARQDVYMPEPAVRVKAITPTTVTFEALHNGQLTAYEPRALDPQAVAYEDGTKLSLSSLKVGDIVVPVTHGSGVLKAVPGRPNGWTTVATTSSVTAFVVLPASVDLKWYDLQLLGGVTRVATCIGNAPDECVGQGGMDLYLKDAHPQAGSIWKEIQGRVTQLNGATVTLASSTGRSFTITFPSDAVKVFNAQHSNNHIGVGSSLDINYDELPDEHSLTITPDKLFMTSLMLQGGLTKQDAPTNY